MFINVAAIQLSVTIGEVEQNLKKAELYIFEAVNKGANIICLPEMFNTGYFSHTSHWDKEYFKLAEHITGSTVQRFQKIAGEYGVYIIVPFFEYEKPGVYYNSAAVINSDGEVIGCYRKTHINWSETGWEKFFMKPGCHYPVFDTAFGRIGIMICYDRDFPEAARILALKGAEIIFVPNGASISLTEMWKKILEVRAYENQVYILGACLTGKTDEEHHDFIGHSILVDPFGKIEDIMGREEGVLVGNIDLTKVHEARMKRFLYRDRRPEIYKEIIEF